jgi:hypothetical protein
MDTTTLNPRQRCCADASFQNTKLLRSYIHYRPEYVVDCVWNVMAHAQKPDFVFRRNGRVHLNRLGRQFSRLLAAEVCASALVMLDTPCSEVVWRVLGTHSIRQFPLHFPYRASPCAITFQLESTLPSHICFALHEAWLYCRVSIACNTVRQKLHCATKRLRSKCFLPFKRILQVSRLSILRKQFCNHFTLTFGWWGRFCERHEPEWRRFSLASTRVSEDQRCRDKRIFVCRYAKSSLKNTYFKSCSEHKRWESGIYSNFSDHFLVNHKQVAGSTPCPKKIVPYFYFFFLGAQCVESGVSCTDCY